MSYKTYRVWKAGVVLVLAALVAWAVVQGNPWIPGPAAAAAIVVILLMRRGVKQVVVDERTYRIAGLASRLAFQVGALIMAFTGATLMAVARCTHPELEGVSNTLLYSAAGLVLFYLVGYYYYNARLGGGELE